jgi:hypothetical protein
MAACLSAAVSEPVKVQIPVDAFIIMYGQKLFPHVSLKRIRCVVYFKSNRPQKRANRIGTAIKNRVNFELEFKIENRINNEGEKE